MDRQPQDSQRPRAGSQSTFQAPLGLSAGSLASSAGSLNQPLPPPPSQQADPVQNRLRGLPGYASSPDFLASRMAASSNPVPDAPVFVGAGAHRPTPPPSVSKPYQSRERVYYHSPQLAATGAAAAQSATSAAASGSARPLSASDLRAEAPPTESLYDDPLSPERRPAGSGLARPSKEIDYLSGVAASLPNRILTGSSLELAAEQQLQPPSADPLDAWVTVFGFSGAQAPAVLAYFQTLGAVVKTELGQRNWLHIQYDSPWAAQKALLKNGSVLPAAGSCMIGVLPTKQAMDQVGHASTSFMSPLKKGAEAGVATPFGSLPAGPTQKPAPRLSPDSTAVPQTPGFPRTTLYSSMAAQPALPVYASSNAAQTASIFTSEAAREQAAAAATECAVVNGSDGLVTKAFNYIFGF